jgi:hypothetical protein
VLGEAMTDDDLASMIKAAELIVAGKDPHVPINTQIKSLAITVLELRDRLLSAARLDFE